VKRATLLALALAACDQRAIVGETPDGGGAGENWVDVSLGTPTHDVDVLFVLDDHPSMSPKQAALTARFAELSSMIDKFAVDSRAGHYHFGVITGDLGAGAYTIGAGQCHPGGDRAALQALGNRAPPSCQAPVGSAWIDLDQIHATNNLPSGQDLATTLGCMASVGDTGCGYQSMLESAYLALHDPPPVNVGFLRPNSAVAIVFVTDRDDCSAPPASDVFDPANAQYGALQWYRCAEFGIVCNGQSPPYGPSSGPLAGCVPAPDGLLYGVDRYLDYFTRPGGLRASPADVLLFAISAPTQPFEVILANPSLGPGGPYKSCMGPVDGQNCAVMLNQSCLSPSDPQFFGTPAVRLQAVVSQSPVVGNLTSICAGDYSDAIDRVGQSLVTFQDGYGCLPSSPPDPNDPRCQVQDTTSNPDGTTTVVDVPSCADQPDQRCWQVRDFPQCIGLDTSGAPTVHLQLTLENSPGPAAQETTTQARCVVVVR
jgi:hypothetical protein